MLNYDNFAVTLGRAVETFRQGREAVPEQKIALRTLTALMKLGGATVEVVDGELRVGGKLTPVTLPGVRGLLTQLESHDVQAIRIEQNAAPAGLFQLLRALAIPFGGFPRDEDPETRLRDAGVLCACLLLWMPTNKRLFLLSWHLRFPPALISSCFP